MMPNPMMNNPIMQLMQVMNSGGNPMAMLNMMAQKNPQIGQVMQMLNGKSTAEMRGIAGNVAKERGTSIEQVAQSLGINLPK